MAKKTKKAAPKRRSGRRRISGTTTDFLTQAAGAVAGFVVGKMASEKLLPNLDEKVKGAGLIAAGMFLVPMVSKGAFAKSLSMGMAVAGGNAILQSTGILAGIAGYLPSPAIAGQGVTNLIAGQGVAAQVAGISQDRRRRDEA